jgi:hypothetical protein
VFLPTFLVLKCVFLIGHYFHFFFCHTPSPTVCIFHFPRFLSFSRHIPDHTVFVFHFPTFSVFPTIFQVLSCEFLIFFRFPVLSPYSSSDSVHFSFSTFFFSRHIPGHSVFVSHFTGFSVFSPYPKSDNLHISFLTFLSVFLSIFHILQNGFLIFHNFQFSRHTPGPTVCISHFSTIFNFSCQIPGPTEFVSHFRNF